MTPCPTCLQPVAIQDKHWGTLFTCPHCNAVFFVDWNGQPEVVKHEVLEEAIESGSEIGSEFNSEFPVVEDQDTFQNFEKISPDAGSDFNSSGEEAVPFVEGANVAPETSTDFPTEEYSKGEVFEPTENFTEGANFQYPSEDSVNLDPAPSSGVDSNDFSDVADFANSNQLAGPITYEVRIEGIESSHLVKELKEAMTDYRFVWDVSDLILSIQKGVLVLPGLSPAKASVLINRIKYLPFKISWRQDVLTNS